MNKGHNYSTLNGKMKVFFSMFCLLYAVEGYTFANTTKLYKDLFTNYEKKLRPGEDQMIPTELKISFYIRSVHEIKESNGEIGVVGSLSVEWVDLRLVWNPIEYGTDLNQTSVFVEDIWTPYLVLINPSREIKPLFSDELACEARYNGYVLCIPPPNFLEAFCNADVKLYPFDSQTCTLHLYAPGYFSSNLIFKPLSSTLNLEMYENDGLWNITNTSIFVHTQHIGNKSYEISKFEITMQRKWHYHFFKLAPIFMLDLMQILVFWLPNESGERISFSMTVLLTEVVFLTVIQEKLPEDRNSTVSYLVYKQLIDMLVSVLIMTMVVYVSNLYSEAKSEGAEEDVKSQSNWTKVISFIKRPQKGHANRAEAFDRFCLFMFAIIVISINMAFYFAMEDEI